MKTIQFGNTGEEVKRAQEILRAQRFFTDTISGSFLPSTREAVLYFQQTHYCNNYNGSTNKGG